MRALLDTHTFLWWVTNSAQISATVQTVIGDRNNQIMFSAASGWEIAIKAQLGKLEIPGQPESFIANQLTLNSFEVLPIRMLLNPLDQPGCFGDRQGKNCGDNTQSALPMLDWFFHVANGLISRSRCNC